MGATTVNVDEWADELMTVVAGCTPASARQALKATLREFTVSSGAWVRQLDPIDIQANKATYYLDPQPDANILFILSINYVDPNSPNSSARPLHPIQIPAAGQWRDSPVAHPTAYAGDSEVPGKFTLFPPVNKDLPKCLRPYVALTLSEPWNGVVPMTFQRFHFDKILDGATGRLMGQPGKPYTNPKLAQYHLRRFRNGISQARDMARRQFITLDAEFTFPRWAV